MQNALILVKLAAAIDTLTQAGALRFPGRWTTDQGRLSAADPQPLLAFQYLAQETDPVDNREDLEKICQAAGVRALEGLMQDGVEYIAVEVASVELAQAIYDAAKAHEKQARARYDELENSSHADAKKLNAAINALGDAVAAEDAARAQLLQLEAAELEAETHTVALLNPWSRATVYKDISALTQAELDAYARHMDDDLREALTGELAPCSPPQFLAAWVERVGPEEAGRVILGS